MKEKNDVKEKYDGDGVEKIEVDTTPKHNNGWALFFSALSLLISLLPICFNMITYYDQHKIIDKVFLFMCFTEYDALWIFTTFILFLIFDWLCLWIHKKYRLGKFSICIACATIITVITEVTWIVLRFAKFDDPTIHINWVNWVGVIEVALTIICAAPVRINALRKGN
jgi:uncharacterized membrane protein